MKSLRITITGTEPLLMHSARLSDPLDPIVKAHKKISGKRTKTEEDLMEMARLEHGGGLYFDDVVGPYIPGDNIWRALQDAAKKKRQGQLIKSGLVMTTDVNPIAYSGPRTVDGLWEDKTFVHRSSAKIKTDRVMRTRPIFRSWAVEADMIYDPAMLNLEDLEDIVEIAGTVVGLGDWRPKFGRFNATLEELSS